jgi:hypothetical protein
MSNHVEPGDRRLMELLRRGDFEMAMREFPQTYTNPHIGYLCGYVDGPPVTDDQGAIPPLSQPQLVAALDYLEGPTKPLRF